MKVLMLINLVHNTVLMNYHAALAWVEYCNGTKDTYYANLRRKNGREEPYNVCGPKPCVSAILI